MLNKEKDLVLKKAVLSAWAKILLDEGYVDTKKYNQMISRINKINE